MTDVKTALMDTARAANRLAVKYETRQQMTTEDWSDLKEALCNLRTAFEEEETAPPARTTPQVGFQYRG